MTDGMTALREPAPAKSTGRRGPRGSYAKSEETRQAILDAALEVFAESGYRGSALRTVADRVGMSEAGLLHHFRSKGKLLIAVLEHRDQHSYDYVPLDTMVGADSIRGLVALAAHNATQPGVVELFCTLSAEATSPDHPAHEYFRNRYEWTHRSISASFRKVADDGDLRPGLTPESAARATVAMMDGLQVQWLLDRDALDMAEELRTFLGGVTTIDLA
ncbi:TetR/AcrR family transcriptional regulator [Arenivirga flava]|uniref:TetR family transcriptional regulator n=1 Tax=Arenivirga flava TaxID=1930060 RepID=A0AA37XD27_9MICO|nr:TetR/AcrR family transcriptional regulator [Arenivirga flava]GMA29102.1 TetR family transcriptional regulator [Arenivirga flava]